VGSGPTGPPISLTFPSFLIFIGMLSEGSLVLPLELVCFLLISMFYLSPSPLFRAACKEVAICLLDIDSLRLHFFEQ
jgi:hypothetical protein